MNRPTLIRIAIVLLGLCRSTRCIAKGFSYATTPSRKARSDDATKQLEIDAIRPDRSSSALRAFIPSPDLAVVGAGVARFYKTSPLLAGFITASTKAVVADYTAQCEDEATIVSVSQ